MASAHHSFRSLSLDSGSKPVAMQQQEASRAVGLYDDPGELLNPLDQGAFFSAVAEGNVEGVVALLKHRKVDINEYNGQGVTALFEAVYNFEASRSVSMAKLLIDHGARATIKALDSPAASKLSYLKHDSPSGSPGSPRSPRSLARRDETRKVPVANKTPLLVALELKSSLYLKGWDYRHWDNMLDLLADATVAELAGRPFHGPGPAQLPAIADGWAAVFSSGEHELVEVWAEGRHLDVLRMLLVVNSKRFKFELDKAAAVTPGRLEISDASFNVVKAVMEFLYSGHVSSEFMAHRGVDLLLAAHKYEVFALQKLCEEQLEPAPESWIKMLAAALQCGSDALVLKVAASIHGVMHSRHATRLFVKQPFSVSIHPEGGPAQLPLIDDADVEERVEVKTL
ncbi:hypothetical protein CLOM_g20320 [Closterium sp. NIES-68]|nr:hypothetical protein CLOM_g20320 [Closterium sp. NIES-68]GJP61735.1 hypothetical protein CLOP_g18873 [Closterium sp. NIES-67]